MVLFLIAVVSFGCTNKKEQTQTKDNKLSFGTFAEVNSKNDA